MHHLADPTTSTGDGGLGIALFFGVIIILGLYLTPTIIAFTRKVPDRGSVAVLNIFLGWSLIGWVVSLAMASRTVPGHAPGQTYLSAPGPSHTTGGAPRPGQRGFSTVSLTGGTGSTRAPRNTAPAPTNPGWHPDPTGPYGVERYYDGQQWTDHTRPGGL